MMKLMLILMVVLFATPCYAGREEDFDTQSGVIGLLAFGRGVLPTAAQCPEGSTEIQGQCVFNSRDEHIEPSLQSEFDGGTGVLTNPGGDGEGVPPDGNGNDTETGDSGQGNSGNENGNSSGKNRSGGGDDTNPGGHGNEEGSENPGQGDEHRKK